MKKGFHLHCFESTSGNISGLGQTMTWYKLPCYPDFYLCPIKKRGRQTPALLWDAPKMWSWTQTIQVQCNWRQLVLLKLEYIRQSALCTCSFLPKETDFSILARASKPSKYWCANQNYSIHSLPHCLRDFCIISLK